MIARFLMHILFELCFPIPQSVKATIRHYIRTIRTIRTIRYSPLFAVRYSRLFAVRCLLFATIRYSLFGFSRHPIA